MTSSFHIAYVRQLPGAIFFGSSNILSEASCAFPIFPSNLLLKLNVKQTTIISSPIASTYRVRIFTLISLAYSSNGPLSSVTTKPDVKAVIVTVHEK